MAPGAEIYRAGWILLDAPFASARSINERLHDRNAIKHKAEIIRDCGERPPIDCSPQQHDQVFFNERAVQRK